MTPVHPSRSRLAHVPIVGLVGGVGSGKSSVVRLVRGLRLFVVDADRIGHELLSVDSIHKQLIRVFGVGILDANGQIERRKLAARVFGDSSEKERHRVQLDEIMHPAIRLEMQEQVRNCPNDTEVVIIDAALLLEAGWANECDAVIFIDTPLKLRLQRTAESRGWSIEEHQRRESSQWSVERKRSFADSTVDNSGTPEAAAIELEQILRTIIERNNNLRDSAS